MLSCSGAASTREAAALLERIGARVLALGPPDRPLADALAAAAVDLERIAAELSA